MSSYSKPIIYKSSAGSGKTYTLVKTYLQLMLAQPESFKQILAVTFTNKATDEMKHRIVNTLAGLAERNGEFAPLAKELQSSLGEQGFAHLEVSTQAHKCLKAILHDYSRFSVSTIESFLQKIIRSFARELHIQLGYEIEMEQQIVLDALVSDILLEVGLDKKEQLTRLLKTLVSRKMEQEKGWDAEREIKVIGAEIFKETFVRLSEMLDQLEDPLEAILGLEKALWEKRKVFEQKMAALGMAGNEMLEAYDLSLEDFKYKKTSALSYFYKISQPTSRGYLPGKRALVALEDASSIYTKNTERLDEIQAAIQGGLLNILQEAIDYEAKQGRIYRTTLEVLKSLHSFGLLQDLKDKLETYRKENNLLLISDTNFLLKEIIEDQETPFIYEKMGTRYTHYLIDEFQDTSSLQWNNLLPLLRESLAQGNGFFLVGDVKQSIYRWRNGDLRLLLKRVEEELADLNFPAEVEELKQNWRTAEEIVHFNNRFFSKATTLLTNEFEGQDEGELLKRAYGDIHQEAVRKMPGLVHIEFFADDNESKWHEKSFEQTLQLINELTEEGFAGNEITILVRKNTEGIRLADFLQKNNIKVASADSLLVINHPEVLFLQAALQVAGLPHDKVAQAALFYYFRELQQKETLSFSLFSEKDPDFQALLDQIKSLQYKGVFDLISYILDQHASLFTVNAYLNGFIEAVHSYISQQDVHIPGFLEWWEKEKRKTSIAAHPEKSAIQIMTLHKAKGLEFPVVIMPIADWGMEPDYRDFLWARSPDQAPFNTLPFLPVHPSSKLKETLFEPQYAEERLMSYLDNINLLYVAFTRPKYRLYIFTKQRTSKAKGLSDIHKLIHKIVEEEFEGEGAQALRIGKKSVIESGSNNLHLDAGLIPLQKVIKDSSGSATANFTIKQHAHKYHKKGRLKSEERIKEGAIYHHALSLINIASDIPQAIRSLNHAGMIKEDLRMELMEELGKIVSAPEAKRFFAPELSVQNEAEIVSASGDVLRPDRVMMDQDRAMVLDYKTGSPEKVHHRQVSRYMEEIKKMGYSRVEGYLYYTKDKKVVGVG